MAAQINLFNAGLLPRETQVPAKWLPWVVALGVVCCGLVVVGIKVKTDDAQREGVQSKTKAEALLAQVNALQAEISQHQPNPLLQAEVRKLEQSLTKRQQVLALLDKERTLTTGGFSSHLQGLARARGEGLWLTRIDLSSEGISLEGKAEFPQAVQTWMARVKAQPTFSGTTFEAFDLLQADGKKPGADPAGAYGFALQSRWQQPSRPLTPGGGTP